MVINNKVNRKTEEVEVKKKVLLENMQELYKGYVIHCQYLPEKDQFFVIRYVDIHDYDAHITENIDYDEVLQWII